MLKGQRSRISVTPRVRLWGVLMLLLGILDLTSTMEAVSAGYAPGPLPLIELALGAAAFFLPTRALLPVYAAVMIWDDLVLMLAGQLGFLTFIGVALFLLLVTDYVQLLLLPPSDLSDKEQAAAQKAALRLPQTASAIGTLSLLLLGAAALSGAGGQDGSTLALVIQNTAVGLALVAIGAGAASLLERHRPWWLPGLGLLLGVIVIAITIWRFLPA
jgi:hypothetical protein